MCGRATLTSPIEDVVELFGAAAIDVGPPRFNIAPGQPILTVRRGVQSQRELVLLKWGLVPRWAKAEEAKKLGGRCIQARAESVLTAPAFRDAFKEHRCLVVVDGFYEWKTLRDGRRVPHHVRPSSSSKLFAIAGLWDRWKTPEGEVIETCAVVTTTAQGKIRDLHDRMPLVVGRNGWTTWLEGSTSDATALLSRSGGSDLDVVAVSPWVNDVRHDDARCLEPLASANEAPGQLGFSFIAVKS
jgi:putative SOS response-associated peptidase YedK